MWGELPADSMSESDRLLLFASKIPDVLWTRFRECPQWRRQTESMDGLKAVLWESALQGHLEQLVMKQRRALMTDDGSVRKGDMTVDSESGLWKYHAIDDVVKIDVEDAGATVPGTMKGRGRGTGMRGRGREGYYKGAVDWSRGVTIGAKVSCHFCRLDGHYRADCWREHPGSALSGWQRG